MHLDRLPYDGDREARRIESLTVRRAVSARDLVRWLAVEPAELDAFWFCLSCGERRDLVVAVAAEYGRLPRMVYGSAYDVC